MDNADLGVEILLTGEDPLVKEELQPLLEVIVTEILEAGSSLATTSEGILESGGIQEEDGREGAHIGRQGPACMIITMEWSCKHDCDNVTY